MAIDYEALGKRISNARKQTGITQEALGELLNMTRKRISVIEAAIHRPSLDTLVDIANALRITPGCCLWFMRDEAKKEAHQRTM